MDVCSHESIAIFPLADVPPIHALQRRELRGRRAGRSAWIRPKPAAASSPYMHVLNKLDAQCIRTGQCACVHDTLDEPVATPSGP